MSAAFNPVLAGSRIPNNTEPDDRMVYLNVDHVLTSREEPNWLVVNGRPKSHIAGGRRYDGMHVWVQQDCTLNGVNYPGQRYYAFIGGTSNAHFVDRGGVGGGSFTLPQGDAGRLLVSNDQNEVERSNFSVTGTFQLRDEAVLLVNSVSEIGDKNTEDVVFTGAAVLQMIGTLSSEISALQERVRVLEGG